MFEGRIDFLLLVEKDAGIVILQSTVDELQRYLNELQGKIIAINSAHAGITLATDAINVLSHKIDELSLIKTSQSVSVLSKLKQEKE